jgi:hypothetical protein
MFVLDEIEIQFGTNERHWGETSPLIWPAIHSVGFVFIRRLFFVFVFVLFCFVCVLCVVCCVLCVVCCVLCVVRCSLFVVRCSLFVVRLYFGVFI